jgi:hypothetical protein
MPVAISGDDMKLIETQWNEFRRKVLPKEAGDVQLTEMRRAFFAGAWAYYSLVMSILDVGEEATARDLDIMAALDAEMREFAERVKKGWA